MTTFLKRVGRAVGRPPSYLVTDHGVQFIADKFIDWCRRNGIAQRFGAIGKYGSLAVIERFIKSLKTECTRLLPVIPLAQAALGRELDAYIDWYNAERPHSRLNGRTPDEVYFGKFPACRKPRFEPRDRWPKRSGCAGHQVLVRGRPGARVELNVTQQGGRKHLPIVTLQRVA